MKYQTLVGALSLCTATMLMTVSAQAAVTLLVDDNIKVTAINGQEIKQGLFQPLTKQFTLESGKHVITAKYDRLYDLSGDNHDYLRSNNVSVTAELADNQTYRLTMPGQPEAYREARKYAEHPTLAIEQDNQVIAQQESVNGSGGGLFSGISSAIGGMFGGGNAQTANQQAIAALETPNASSTAVNANNTSTLDKFMQLWLQATPEEREKIRQWIQE
ncbi:DUF2057 family protein [Psychrobacter sp. I-STPA10]|uniref:DUF2057 family protein n=1 Tax=Psychrobacter sp. I-STPA10 TaxID=2585769 RepID=UPI001E285BB5|nr:DUF2057 family protein [Psychrobacter sp. I-STPA10]